MAEGVSTNALEVSHHCELPRPLANICAKDFHPIRMEPSLTCRTTLESKQGLDHCSSILICIYATCALCQTYAIII